MYPVIPSDSRSRDGQLVSLRCAVCPFAFARASPPQSRSVDSAAAAKLQIHALKDRKANQIFLSLDFVDEHPGGARVIQRFAGKNASKAFWKYHGESVLKKYGDKFKIGTVAESAKL